MTDWTLEIAGQHRNRFQSGGTRTATKIFLDAAGPSGSAFEDGRFGAETAMMTVPEDQIVVRAGPSKRVIALMPPSVRPRSVTIVPRDWSTLQGGKKVLKGLQQMPDVVLAAMPGKQVHQVVSGGPFKPGTMLGDAVIESVLFVDLWGRVWHPPSDRWCGGMTLHTETPLLDRSKPGLAFVPSCDVPLHWS